MHVVIAVPLTWCFTVARATPLLVYYESIKREPKIRGIYERFCFRGIYLCPPLVFFLFDRRFESAGGYIHKYVFGQAHLQI